MVRAKEETTEGSKQGRNLSVLICCRDRGIEGGAVSLPLGRSIPLHASLPATLEFLLRPWSYSFLSYFLRVPFRIRRDSLSIGKEDSSETVTNRRVEINTSTC